MKCYIIENSFIAKLAARKLGAFSAAIVIGKTIHLHNAGKEEFVTDTRWLRHEMAHIKQFQQYGYLLFMLKYLWESARKGYINNKYEVEARIAEDDDSIVDGILQ